MKHSLMNVPRGTAPHLINSFFEREPELDLTCYLASNELVESDFAITERLVGAFTKANDYEESLPKEDRPNQGVWEMMKHEFHGPTYKLLWEGDTAGLAKHLSNGLRTSLAHGLGLGPSVYSALASGGEGTAANILIIKDRLISLAIALGVLPLENPEQGQYGENIHISLSDLVSLIERAAGAEIYRPPVAGIFGLLVGDNKIIDARVPDDVYAAVRIGCLSKTGTVAEIGGGFGGAAFQCARVGLRPTIYDLPIVGLLQGYFLIKIFGGDNVKLYGEDIEDRLVNVLPWWMFYDRSRTFDVVFNRDSMAEFPLLIARNYLLEIKNRAVFYLSINQEVENCSGQPGIRQIAVGRLASELGLHRSCRFPYWIRRGYVEELFH